MSSSNTPPDPWKAIQALNRRVDILERRRNDLDDPFKPEIVFSYSGPLATATSPPYPFAVASRMFAVVCAVGTPGGTATTVDILKDDDPIGTATIPAGATIATVPISSKWSPDQDILKFEITSAGSGAVDLTVSARFRRV